MTQSKQCPKCAGAMAEGFVVDHTHGNSAVASWVAGDPVKSFWLGRCFLSITEHSVRYQ